MEVIVKTDYQDVYRISYGVLLVVNKFEYITISDGTCPRLLCLRNGDKPYKAGCMKELRVLKKKVVHEPSEFDPTPYEFPVGTVLHSGLPVQPTENKDKWKHEIKTTGSCFSGSKEEVLNMIKDITDLIEE